MRSLRTEPAEFVGQKWRNTHQATVDAVLGSGTRKVTSRGTQFYNKDNWTARAFATALCEWARLNPAKTPDERDVQGWLNTANYVRLANDDKGIVIAATPDELPRGLAMALVGGGYHEAWHTEYSRTKPISIYDVWPRVAELWALAPYEPENNKRGWAGLVGAMLTWSNLIEDIRIERCGCRKYPGAYQKMEALQDLILEMENEGQSASEHRAVSQNEDLTVVMGTFRDLGLGYETPNQKGVLLAYQKRSQKGWDFVTKGALKPFLDRAIAMSATDDMGSLWLAMEVVAAIAKITEAPPPPPKGTEKAPGATKPPPPNPKAPPQNEELPNKDEPPPEEESETAPSTGKITYKLGDRAVLTTGPYKGRTVEITRAGLPDPKTNIQDLEFALVEPD